MYSQSSFKGFCYLLYMADLPTTPETATIFAADMAMSLIKISLLLMNVLNQP